MSFEIGRSVCPGVGICERITGVDGTEQEAFEEASAGCPYKCSRLATKNDSEISQIEANYYCRRVENFVTEYKLGKPFDPTKLSIVDSDLVKFWYQTEEQLQRDIWSDLGLLARGFLKQQ